MSENTTDTTTGTTSETITTGTETITGITSDTPVTENGMVAHPRKEGIPLFLQTQNRDQWQRGAGPLLIFEVAKHALAAATTVEEVKDIRDKALGLAAYARKANERQLEAEAVEIRARAARRLGEMIEAQKGIVGLNTGTAGKGRPPSLGGSTDNPPKDDRPTLASQGIDKALAHEARTLAKMPENKFEEHVAAKAQATRTRRPAQRRASKPKRSYEQRLLEQYPITIRNVCERVKYISIDEELGLEIPPGLTAETAAALLLDVRAAIKNQEKMEVALAEIARGGAGLQ